MYPVCAKASVADPALKTRVRRAVPTNATGPRIVRVHMIHLGSGSGRPAAADVTVARTVAATVRSPALAFPEILRSPSAVRPPVLPAAQACLCRRGTAGA